MCKSLFAQSNGTHLFPTKNIRFQQRFVSRETKISELLDSDGKLWLFRTIRNEYEQGFDKTNFIKPQLGKKYGEKGYSYSLNPRIGETWDPVFGKYILISRQNLAEDNLKFPRKSLQDLAPLLGESAVGEILDFYEVKVPVDKEQLVAIIEQSRLREIAREFGDSEFSMAELLQKVLRDPSAKLAGRDF